MIRFEGMQPGTLVAGKYRAERVIGRGGMGFVVEATHIHLETRVALKFLAEAMASDPTALARFRREAQASAQLKGEHICRVSDFGIEGKVPYIVMELLAGADLARLSRVRVLDVATAALFVRQACVGLAEAHAARIIHRDLKPGNLFLTRREDGSPLIKILDFGVAKTDARENDAKLTGTSNVVGSPGFMSPEQFRSSRSVDARTDVWALGAILYKLVSGRLPFKGNGFAELALAVTRDPMPPLDNVPQAFEQVVARCLAKDPAQRFPDVEALGAALAPFTVGARPFAQHITLLDEPTDEPGSGIGGIDGPDSGMRTHGSAPISAPPTAAKSVQQTLLGVSSAAHDIPARVAHVPVTASVEGAIAAPAGELPSGTVVGEYVIDRRIGAGGMGVVYGATHPLIGKRAAIKVIGANLGSDPVVVQRFVQEARSVNQIGHPNIVDVFAFGNLPDGRNYFMMEYLQGESLRARLSRAFMTIAEAVQILDEIAGALEAAHEKLIVHRDLKPDNVFLASVRGGLINVKLLDFGIAKLVAGDGGIAKTSTGELIGTPAYLSPEQARGRNVDYRTDIYSLGVMMFEMLTGRIPFMAESAMDIVLMHVSVAPQRPSELLPSIPPLLEQLLLQMLDKEADRRPALSQVRNVFAELVASGQIEIEPGSGATFRSDLTRRHGDLESRTPPSAVRSPLADVRVPAAQLPTLVGPGAPTTTRHRPSEAPTLIAFHPGTATITPSDQRATAVSGRAPSKPSRRGMAIAIVLLAALVPVVTIAIGLANRGGHDTPRDAEVASTVPAALPHDAAAGAQPEASPGAAGLDADAAPLRQVTISTTVKSAKIEIDGAAVAAPSGSATVSLSEGAHRLVVSAAGRTTFDRTIDVTRATTAFEIRLERTKERLPTRPATGSAANGVGSGSANYSKDGTIDPFAP